MTPTRYGFRSFDRQRIMLNVLGRVIVLEPKQADLLQRICDGPTISRDEISGASDATPTVRLRRKVARRRSDRQGELIT